VSANLEPETLPLRHWQLTRRNFRRDHLLLLCPRFERGQTITNKLSVVQTDQRHSLES
jgi:hypothetical protein